ncbi:MAG: S-layer homology domain-containing protein, partial [Oscillospiraceae bacterium]
DTDYYYDAVLWAVDKGVTSGISATTFAPNATCTRAQAVTFLWRAEGKPVVNYAMNFTDVTADSYYAEAVRWAVSEGITGGTGANTFSPVADCTRAQIVTFLYRCLSK